MQAIIMAAGMGTRLGSMTKDVPKALISVHNMPLLGRQLKSLLSLSEISEIIVVVGYLGKMVEEYVFHCFKDPRIKVVFNPTYEKGPIVTVYQARKFIHESFFVLNVDHLFSTNAYRKVTMGLKTVLIGSFNNREPYEDERKVVLYDNGQVGLVKKAKSYYCGYTGLVAIDQKYIDLYFDLALNEINKGNDSYHPDDLIRALSDKIPLQIFDLSGHTFLEIDTFNDYVAAQTEIFKLEKEELL